eukprot:UN3056
MWRNWIQSYVLDAVAGNGHPTTKVEVQSKPSHQDTTHANEEPAPQTCLTRLLSAQRDTHFRCWKICPGGTHTCHGKSRPAALRLRPLRDHLWKM